MRITGTHMDELMDGLAQGQPAPQTSLQNAVLVRPASTAPNALSSKIVESEASESSSVTRTLCHLEPMPC